jgi:hypothetical protein
VRGSRCAAAIDVILSRIIHTASSPAPARRSAEGHLPCPSSASPRPSIHPDLQLSRLKQNGQFAFVRDVRRGRRAVDVSELQEGGEQGHPAFKKKYTPFAFCIRFTGELPVTLTRPDYRSFIQQQKTLVHPHGFRLSTLRVPAYDFTPQPIN